MDLKNKTILFLGSSVTYGSASQGVSFVDIIRDNTPGYHAELNVAMIGSTQEDAYITYQKSVFKRGWLGFLKYN